MSVVHTLYRVTIKFRGLFFGQSRSPRLWNDYIKCRVRPSTIAQTPVSLPASYILSLTGFTMQYNTLCANLVPQLDRRRRHSSPRTGRDPPSSWIDFLKANSEGASDAYSNYKRIRSATSHDGSQERGANKRPRIQKTVTFAV